MTACFRVGRRADLPAEAAVEIDLGDGRRAALFDVGGELLAIGARCRHQGGPLHEGAVVAGPAVRCPWHGWTYDLRTGARVDRAGEPLATLGVELVEGWIHLEEVPACASPR